MHETVAPLAVGLNVVGSLGISGAFLGAGSLIGRRWKQAMYSRHARLASSTTEHAGHSPFATDGEPVVSDNPREDRFEVRIGGELVGVSEYRRVDDVVTLHHTEISPRHRGRGLAGTLIKFALDASHNAGWFVEPTCPYVRAYIDKHPEYEHLLASRRPTIKEVNGCCGLPS